MNTTATTKLYKFISTMVKKIHTRGEGEWSPINFAKKLNNDNSRGTEPQRKVDRRKVMERHTTTFIVASPTFTGGEVYTKSRRKRKAMRGLDKLFDGHWRKSCSNVLRKTEEWQWKGDVHSDLTNVHRRRGWIRHQRRGWIWLLEGNFLFLFSLLCEEKRRELIIFISGVLGWESRNFIKGKIDLSPSFCSKTLTFFQIQS